jgi:AcrR family transcriptional regulator
MDRRARRTRDALIRAVRDLLGERPWDRVTVRSICERADVSRSAFYAHCADRDQALDLAFGALRDALGRPETSRGLDRHGTFAFLPALVEHMRGHLPLFERNRSTTAQAAIYLRFRAVVEELALDALRTSRRVEADDDVVAFAVGGMFATLEQWCERGCLVPNERIISGLDRHLTRLLRLDLGKPHGSE